MRKEKEREKLRELEELQKSNPELAAEKINSEEAVRIMERASLKHRNSSKYLQQQAKRAKNNNDKDVSSPMQILSSLFDLSRKFGSLG